MKKTIIFTIIILWILAGCSNVSEENDLKKSMENQILIPSMISNQLDLPQSIMMGNDSYEIIWESSDTDIIDATGLVKQTDEDISVTLKATVHTQNATHTMIFEVTVMKKEKVNHFIKPHQILVYADRIDKAKLNDLKLVDHKLELEDNMLEATYESDPIETPSFTKMVGSWSAISSLDATVELQVKVMVDGIWSKYLSYRAWGLGRNNFSLDASDHIAKISTDEIMILNDKKAQQIQYKMILKRKDISISSPKLELVSFALTIPNYTYTPSTDHLPSFLDYEVPMLNQQEVIDIGSSICSPTSAAMLLLYKGHDLSIEDELPHRFTARLFRDYGANIYGNWVFNTVGMSSYNETAYVGVMYSFEELMIHLAQVGPVAASVSGDMGLYHTNGHLIVVRGYRITDFGDVYVLVNDPNINARFGNDANGDPLYVYYEFPLETFMKTWKGIAYVIE
ncbi:hypothetical protein BK011_06975 [Tenericutes bacterium MZ-XQ]|nr:hypothetical protein BK011_06975 [Tenericutes bacterium MZ-XQ]